MIDGKYVGVLFLGVAMHGFESLSHSSLLRKLLYSCLDQSAIACMVSIDHASLVEAS